MRMRGGVRRFQTGGVNPGMTPQQWLAQNQGGGVGTPNPAQTQALQAYLAQLQGAGQLPGAGAAPAATPLAAPGAVVPPATPNTMGPLNPGAAMPGAALAGATPPGAAGGMMPQGGAAGAPGAGMNPQMMQARIAAMNQARSAGQNPAIGGVNPITPAGAGVPGGANFAPRAAGMPGPGAQNAAAMGTAPGLNPQAIQQAALARQAMGGTPWFGGGGGVGGAGGAGLMANLAGPGGPTPQPTGMQGTPGGVGMNVGTPGQATMPFYMGSAGLTGAGMKRGGSVKVKLSSGRKLPSGGHTANTGPDTQFGVSGSSAPSPKKGGAEKGRPSGLANGGRMREASGQIRGGGGPGHQPDQQFGVSGPPAPTPKQAQAGRFAKGGKAMPPMNRVRDNSGRAAVASPNDRDTNLTARFHGARQWGDTMRAAEDVPAAPVRVPRGVVRRRPVSTSTPSPYDYEGPDNTPVMAKGGKWIQGAIKHPGALRAQLGVKEGQKIPPKKLAAAAEKGGKLGRRARLAQTLGKLRKRKGGECEDKMAKGGACPPDKMAAGGAAKQRKGFPNTIPPPKRLARGGALKVRGAGAAERGTQFKGIF